MFSEAELSLVLQKREFQDDLRTVQESLVAARLEQPLLPLNDAQARLAHFVEGVLASAPEWQGTEAIKICSLAGQAAEMLAMHFASPAARKRMRLRAALLYELADLPSLSWAVVRTEKLQGLLGELFSRTGVFGKLTREVSSPNRKHFQNSTPAATAEGALSQDALALGAYEQGNGTSLPPLVCSTLREIATWISLDLSGSELAAFKAILKRRAANSTRANVAQELFERLRDIDFPVELWAPQVMAIQGGLLDHLIDAWGLAAPTGTGKTFLTRVLIYNHLLEKPNTTVLYLVPSKALVNEVSASLASAFRQTPFRVTAVAPHIVGLSDQESQDLTDTAVAVLTPEKADLLLRVGVDFIKRAALVVVDEAHHIEAETRGVLLELYLWRLRRLLSDQTRLVFLSAVAPNVTELAESMGRNPKGVFSDRRATRMRVGVFRIKGAGSQRRGWIDYSDGTSFPIIGSKPEPGIRKGIVQLAEKIRVAGPVLVVAKGKGECEALANEMRDWLASQNRLSELPKEKREGEYFQRLDSRLEREMYADIAMRKLLPNRIAYHHAGLPPRVRHAVEESIRNNLVDFVFATTTLAEGVNFPFSSVIVQSLALREPPEKGRPSRYRIVTPRSFWNIAGRAGRPGFDKEGQVILYEPSLGLEKVNAVLDKYLDASLTSIEPVQSALALALKEIIASLEAKEFSRDDIKQEVLSVAIPKRVHGLVNLIRVGLVHAKASGILSSPEEILDGTFAARQLTPPLREKAVGLIQSQSEVVDEFLSKPNAPPIGLIAELGVSIETLSQLRDYAGSLTDWQLSNLETLFYGGKLNLNQAKYIIGPVAKRMAELEGPKLGGFYAEVILNWLSGIPLEAVRKQSKGSTWDSLEQLISVIYSRVQYLLPWGLYAMDRIVEEESLRRHIIYNNEICDLAYLADAGVPSFDALRLTQVDFERVDATRLAEQYHRKGGRSLGVDIVGWLKSLSRTQVEACLRGQDNRRIDYDLGKLLDALQIA